MIAISPDTPEKNDELARDLDLGFPVVGDEGLALSRRFGIVFQAPGRDPLPVPAVYLVDGSGMILFHYVHPNYKIRLDPELLVTIAERGDGGGRAP